MYAIGQMIDGKFVPGYQAVSRPVVWQQDLLDPLADVKAWREKNPEAWAQMVRWASEDAASDDGKGRCSAKLYIELLRRPHFAAKLGFTVRPMDKQVKIKNALTPYFARLMMEEHEELKGHFRTGTVPSDSYR